MVREDGGTEQSGRYAADEEGSRDGDYGEEEGVVHGMGQPMGIERVGGDVKVLERGMETIRPGFQNNKQKR